MVNLQGVISVLDLEADTSRNKLTSDHMTMERSNYCASTHLLNLVYGVGLKDLGVLRNIFPALVLQSMALLAGVVGWNVTSSNQACTYSEVLVNRSHVESHKVAKSWEKTTTTTSLKPSTEVQFFKSKYLRSHR